MSTAVGMSTADNRTKPAAYMLVAGKRDLGPLTMPIRQERVLYTRINLRGPISSKSASGFSPAAHSIWQTRRTMQLAAAAAAARSPLEWGASDSGTAAHALFRSSRWASAPDTADCIICQMHLTQRTRRTVAGKPLFARQRVLPKPQHSQTLKNGPEHAAIFPSSSPTQR